MCDSHPMNKRANSRFIRLSYSSLVDCVAIVSWMFCLEIAQVTAEVIQGRDSLMTTADLSIHTVCQHVNTVCINTSQPSQFSKYSSQVSDFASQIHPCAVPCIAWLSEAIRARCEDSAAASLTWATWCPGPPTKCVASCYDGNSFLMLEEHRNQYQTIDISWDMLRLSIHFIFWDGQAGPQLS